MAIVLGCTSGGTSTTESTGSPTTTSGGGGSDIGAAGAGGGGAAGTGGTPDGNTIVGFMAICDAVTEEADCNFMVNESQQFWCAWQEVELLPDMHTCSPGTPVGRCLAQQPWGQGSCTAVDCPAEPAGHAYYFRELEDGSVQLYHYQDFGCTTIGGFYGFAQCQMKPTDPEACLCRCEI